MAKVTWMENGREKSVESERRRKATFKKQGANAHQGFVGEPQQTVEPDTLVIELLDADAPGGIVTGQVKGSQARVVADLLEKAGVVIFEDSPS